MVRRFGKPRVVVDHVVWAFECRKDVSDVASRVRDSLSVAEAVGQISCLGNVDGVSVDPENVGVCSECLRYAQCRVPEPGTEIENTERSHGASEGCNELNLRCTGIVEAAAVFALVRLALAAHLDNGIAARKLHEQVNDITPVPLFLRAPSLPFEAARVPVKFG